MSGSEHVASLADVLVLLFFLGFPLLGRLLRAWSERQQERQRQFGPPPDAQTRRREVSAEIRELEQRGADLWKQLLGGEPTATALEDEEDDVEEEFEAPPPPPPRAQRPERTQSTLAEPLSTSGAGSLAGGSFLDDDDRSSAAGRLGGLTTPAPEPSMASGAWNEDRLGDLAGGLAAPLAGNRLGTTLEPTRAARVAHASDTGPQLTFEGSTTTDLRRAIVLSEILAPPIALREGDWPPAPPGLG